MAKIPKSMKLTRLVQEWLDEQKWETEIEINAENTESKMVVDFTIDQEHHCRLFIESAEKQQWLSVFLYSPIIVPVKRYDEACKFVNCLNRRLGVGRVAVDKKGPFQFCARIDLEGCNPTTRVITNMVDAAVGFITNWTEQMGQIVYTGKTADAVFEELDAKNDSSKPKSTEPDKKVSDKL